MFWWASELKYKATPDPIVEKAQSIPCDKITEGVATLRQDNDELHEELRVSIRPCFQAMA